MFMFIILRQRQGHTMNATQVRTEGTIVLMREKMMNIKTLQDV